MLYILYLCNVYSEHFLADSLIVFLYPDIGNLGICTDWIFLGCYFWLNFAV